jgi:hypothetical protein
VNGLITTLRNSPPPCGKKAVQNRKTDLKKLKVCDYFLDTIIFSF